MAFQHCWVGNATILGFVESCWVIEFEEFALGIFSPRKWASKAVAVGFDFVHAGAEPQVNDISAVNNLVVVTERTKDT